MGVPRKDVMKAVRDELADATVEAEPFGEESFGLTVLWDGFAGVADADRQEKVRAAVTRRLGAGADAQVAFIIAWTPAEKKQFDIDKL